MDEILSRFPDIAEDIFESLDDESLVHCKEAIRSISSFMEEGTKFWKRIIRKYLDNKNFLCSHFKESWEILMDKKKTRPEIIKELGRAVQHYLNRHGGKCFEASLYEGRKETCSHREPSLSPLHVAAEAGNTLLCKYILERSEDKNPIVVWWRMDFEFDGEWTPLLAAARYGHLDVCLAIMDGLNAINPGTNEAFTPLHAAATGGHLQICIVILEKLGNKDPIILNPEDDLFSTPLHYAARKGHVQVFKVLLDVAWNKNPADNVGRTPLHYAARYGHVEICKMIMSCIDDLNPCDYGEAWTPLELATREGHLQVCEVMMSFMKDKNPKSKKGPYRMDTPLHIAAANGYLDICNAIMKQTADKNPVDRQGWTPLHCAAKEGHIQIIKAIHNHVVDKNPVDKKGQTPMTLFLKHANAKDDMNDIIWE